VPLVLKQAVLGNSLYLIPLTRSFFFTPLDIIMFYYVYVLKSERDGNNYVGYTNNLRKRLKEHELGHVKSTKHRLPVRLIYFEACLNQQDATKREKYLKTSWGKRYIKSRLSNYLTG